MEKRSYSRLEASYPASIAVNEEDSFNIPAEIVDLSENGLKFRTSERIPQKPLVFIEIDLSRHPALSQVAAKGQIIWSHLDYKNKKFQYGIFCEPSEEVQFRQTVKELMQKNNNGYFLFELNVFLKDTNLFGNTYFSHYFEWQGMARETYFQTVPDYHKLLASGIKMITKRASIEYKRECTAFDHVIIKVQNKNIRKCSFDMVFNYINERTEEILAVGEQTLTFADAGGKITRIPEAITKIITKHSAN